MTQPLVLNNGQVPTPTPTDRIVLREFALGPIPQSDEDLNFINIVDRINSLNTTMPIFDYDETTRILNITQN